MGGSMKTKISLDLNEAYALYTFLSEYVPLFAMNRDIVSAKDKVAKAFMGVAKEPQLPKLPDTTEPGDFNIQNGVLHL